MQKAAFFKKLMRKNIGRLGARFFYSFLALVLITGVPACSAKNDEDLLQNEPGFGELRVSEKDGMAQVYVPAGTFIMGEVKTYSSRAYHQVDQPGFWIDKTEVTGGMYTLFLNDLHPTDDVLDEYLSKTSCFSYSSYKKEWESDSYCENRPVGFVTWYGAAAYCEWAGRSLPTEAEWEKAARGENAGTYPGWGNAEPSCQLAQYSDCKDSTIDVGSLPLGASVYGALDMAGNVWEWVANKSSDSYLYRESPGQRRYGSQSDSEARVIRGGSVNSEALLLPVVVWDGMEPDDSAGDLGFRCASPE